MGNTNTNTKNSKQQKNINKPSSSSSSLSISSTISTDSPGTRTYSNATTTFLHPPSGAAAPCQKPLPLCHAIHVKHDEKHNHDILLLTATKQEHLLLLHHCYSCTCTRAYKNNSCPYTPQQCAATKSLLQHIKTCNEGQKCRVPHCQSSRDILRHFYNCSNEQCECCPVVRMVMAKGGGGGAHAMQRRRPRRVRKNGRVARNITTLGKCNILTPLRRTRQQR